MGHGEGQSRHRAKGKALRSHSWIGFLTHHSLGDFGEIINFAMTALSSLDWRRERLCLQQRDEVGL